MKNLRNITVISLVVWLAGFAEAGSRLDFDPSQGLVVVPVRIDNRFEGNFGVDTGADRLYLNRGFVQRLGSPFDERPSSGTIHGIGGSSQAQDVTLNEFRIGNERVMDVTASIVDLSRVGQDSDGNVPDGLIGHDVLRQFYVTVDYPSRTMSLDREPPRFLSGRQYREEVFTLSGHFIIIPVSLNGLPARPMMLDYCASVSSITSAFARDLGLESRGNDLHYVESMELESGTRVDSVVVLVQDLSPYYRAIGRKTFDGILGGTFLEDLTVTVDYHRARLYLR